MALICAVGELGCHSSDTQVFTPDGIRDWKDVKVGDDVFGVDDVNTHLVLVTKVLEKFSYDYSGEMFHFSDGENDFFGGYDFLVTPNHRMIFKEGRRKFRYMKAGELKTAEGRMYSIICGGLPYASLENLKVVDYDGVVWCFRTGTGNFFTVRNGKVSLSGNSGKTLSLTYLAFRNWYLKDRRLFANYTLFGMPFYRLETIKQLDMIRDGFVAVDEVWLWGLDSRCSQRKINRIMGNILARSRKRKLTYGFTVQTMSQLDKRLAKVLDFIAYPILNRTETICKLVVCDITRKPLKVFRFRTAPIFKMYKTDEEVSEILDDVTGSKSGKKDEAYDAGRPEKIELPFREPEIDDDKPEGGDEDGEDEGD